MLFGESSTPNFHKMAREFVLLDNFYVNSDVSADGHNWATAAIAPDYTQRMWPSQYAGRSKIYNFEGSEPANSPPAGYLWTNAAQAGITIANYGYFAENRAKAGGGWQVRCRECTIRFSRRSPTWTTAPSISIIPDVERAKVFIDDLSDLEKAGMMPQLLIMRMGNDHTSGTTAGKDRAALRCRR